VGTFDIREAKTHLSRLIDKALEGEEVVIAKAGRPVARLVPLPRLVRRRTRGSARDLVHIEPDFDDPLPHAIRRRFE
jgi:prevent-host-death family protein